MIKYNIKTVNDWLYNSNPIKGMYYNGRRVYRRFVANGQPTPPTPPAFEGKWKATYSDSHVESAECDSSSEISYGEINGTNLVSVEIGDCVTTIDYGVFQGCTGLTSCTIGSGVTSIGDAAFYYCDNLTSITIPNGVTSISYRAFQGCSGLTSIVIPNSVTSIGIMAFSECGSLTSINIPSGVTSIGDNAFEECRSLTSVTISDSVTSIGSQAFFYCTSLTSVTVEATTPPTLGSNVFRNTSSNLVIYVPSQSLEAYKNAWAEYASRIQPIS
jgi:hypothetical protein